MTSSEVALVPPTPQYPDPATLTPEQRAQVIDSYRKRMDAGEEHSQQDQRHAVDVSRCDRATAQRERKKAGAEAKSIASAPRLEDLV
jgi:hypothetical protein